MRLTFLGIHPDDIELSCGGTVALACLQGHNVTLVDLSRGESSSNGTPEEREKEAAEAARILGVKDRLNLGLPDTRIYSEDAGQTSAVVDVIRKLRPEIAFIPNRFDPHPDHASGGGLIERALYMSGIHGYMPRRDGWKVSVIAIYAGRLPMKAHMVIDVSTTHKIKMQAIKAHATQFSRLEGRKASPINDEEFLSFIEARSRLFGNSIGAAFGEPFRLMTPLAVRDISIMNSD